MGPLPTAHAHPHHQLASTFLFDSVQIVSEERDTALIVALVGSPDNYLEHNRLQRLGNSKFAVESMLASLKYAEWRKDAPSTLPSDWEQLVTSSSE